MESPYSDAWYCDICGGYFTIEDFGNIVACEDGYHVCEECHSGFNDFNDPVVLGTMQ